ncbi:SigB/SigF/SigG family RNA polymerase sigma factor [Streptomyces decoyicus]|uniref:SigB/SigF/SigG family RNA polymerase sigma factor n=1 Tax=Streptomyces decoyicus TaxID=249567 RepID=A0ABZ1F9I3_9ACTN|nr:SigB/SigF/SigG family RNA polymerase sigma factor [Streptomyces decoyicus]WSB66861.1 SigB/SigF/SigG family RNA polymerase sigma factor [Streptomyces decoyicus]
MSSNSTLTVGTEPETTSPERAVPAPTVLPQIQVPQRVAPSDARELSKQFLQRLQELEEGTPEYQYARNTLIEMNLTLVRYVARRFSSRRESMEDVLQVGTIGLIKAIDRYDPSRDVEFTTLAVPYIQGEIKRFFRDTTWSVRVPRRLQELRIDLARAREELENEGSHEPTAADLAAHLDLEEEEVTEGLVAGNGYDCDSIDRPIRAGGKQQTGLVADLIGTEDPALALAEDVQALKPHLAKLDDRERTLLRMRFGAEMTQAEIGKELGLSQMHISRLLTRACTTLRKGLMAEG